ncbi:MAG: phosphodiester glycosidase family protein [Verrucomicrobiota bacterium]|nr:phosphodiester glycosidase family protein [Verrucomicrobiota bacterium]
MRDPLPASGITVVIALVLTCVLLPGCTSQTRSPDRTSFTRAFPPGPSPADSGTPVEVPLPRLGPAPSFPDQPLSRQLLPAGIERVTSRGIALTFFLFDDRNYEISVVDKEDGPKSEWPSAGAAAKAHGALAAINGGFFTPEGSPLGLVIENGKRIGTWNAGSSLTSGVLSVEKSPRILRRRHWRSFSPTLHLVQAGPFLIENDIVVNGLSNREHSPRSFLVWNGRHHWAFGYSGKATLSELALALAAQPLAKLNITTALNLDGGRSSDLWVSPQVRGGPISTRKSWNNPVRNYLLLHHRPQS